MPEVPSAADLLGAMEDRTFSGTYVARVWNPAAGGPSPAIVSSSGVHDISESVGTVRSITESEDPVNLVRSSSRRRICSVEEIIDNSWTLSRDESRPWLLSPFDLHPVKAAGVTFASSMIERVIEERALGNAQVASGLRDQILTTIGGSLVNLKPGSSEADELKAFLLREGLWSQYLEVGIGPYAEIFTKAPPLASVGFGAEVGISAISSWNNPEPEVVLAVSSRGRIVGATLGNDVNLRDIEGRSALLLGRAKDNNASCSIGPWLRLIDETFSERDLSRATIDMLVTGTDGFALRARARMAEMSRSLPELAGQLMGPHHQYPDGAALFLGTPFAPVEDRDEVGRGFTHHVGDIVTIASSFVGSLANTVNLSENCEPWTMGLHSFFGNLASRGVVP
jgi:fumarylacetoacetate (FAA) hydrolase family protein